VQQVKVADGAGQTLGEFGYRCGDAARTLGRGGLLWDEADGSRRPRRIRPPDGFRAFSLWFSVSSVVDPRLFRFTTENTEGHREGRSSHFKAGRRRLPADAWTLRIALAKLLASSATGAEKGLGSG